VYSGSMEQIRIGILEGQSILRNALSTVLSSKGYVVSASETAQRFLMDIRSRPVNAAVIDLHLSDAEADGQAQGWMAVRELAHWFPETSVILLADSLNADVEARAQREGVALCLQKSVVDCAALEQAILSCVKGERWAPVTSSSPLQIDRREELDAAAAPLRELTQREREVLSYVAGGFDNLKIAATLNIRERTVRAHVSSLYRKMAVENRTQLALSARRCGIRPPAHS
jgi:two-component system, NarL family, nitrate/nitrite response regulator NarL